MTSWAAAAIAAVLLGVALRMKQHGQVSPAAAVEYLRRGALVIDVRTAGEYVAGHLPQAVNMPLAELEQLAARKAPDKSRVLLLHCQSGVRSGRARKQLRAMGYAQVYNLGSYGRAAGIVGGRA